MNYHIIGEDLEEVKSFGSNIMIIDLECGSLIDPQYMKLGNFILWDNLLQYCG